MEDYNKTAYEVERIELDDAELGALGVDGVEPEADEEEILILVFNKPYKFEGREYTEVDLSGLEDIAAKDITIVNKILSKKGIVMAMPEMTVDFAIQMAARVVRLPVEFFERLPAREVIKLKNIVTGFLYGGDGEG